MKRTVSNRTFIIYFSAVAVVGLIYGVMNFHRAFPEMALNIQVSRQEAIAEAKSYLTNRNFDLTDYNQSVIFSSYGTTKHFIDMELGVETLTELAGDSIDIWYWNVRFFKPLQKLEYRVKINPAGEVIGFDRRIAEAEAGSLLSPEVAKIMAEVFLVNQLQVDLDRWEYIEVSSEDRPKRGDHTFTYELKDFKVAEAPYRLKVDMQGATISGYNRFLKIPEEWRRKYSEQRSDNQMYQNIANFLSFLIIVAMFFYFFRHIRQRQIPWKAALWLGGILGVANFAMTLNSIPLLMSGFDTTKSMAAFLGQPIIFGIIGALTGAMLIIILVGAGEMLYRSDHPSKLALHNMLSRRGYRTREFVQATFMGYIMVPVTIGFVVFYYIIGKKIGFWAPANIEFSNTVSTWIPWIYPLAISLGAAMNEEFWYRLFGISFFQRLTKSKILAVVIPAFIWGFLHSNYPQTPGFARGVEVGIIGIIAGVVMLRFGIWATLVWHFVVDAVWIGLALFQSDSTYLWISGLLVIVALLVPALVAFIIYLRTREFESAEDLLNRNTEAPPQLKLRQKVEVSSVDPDQSLHEHQQLTNSVRRAILVTGIAGIIVTLIPTRPDPSDAFDPIITRTEAIEIAKTGLQEKYDINPDDFLLSIIDTEWLIDDSDYYKNYFYRNLAYIHKYGDLDIAKDIYFGKGNVQLYYWSIHLEKEFDPVSYRCAIDKHRGTAVFWPNLSDTTAGAELEIDSARVLATAAFEENESEHMRYEFLSENSRQRSFRRDHYFDWRDSLNVVGEAYLYNYVNIKGDVVDANPKRGLKIPEGWSRKEKERSTRFLIAQIFGIGLILLVVVRVLLSIGRNLVRRQINWRVGWIAGGLLFIILALDRLNALPTLYWDYNSSVAVSKFLFQHSLRSLLSVLAPSLFVLLVVSLADALVRSYYNQIPWLSKDDPKRVRLDDIIILIGSLGLIVGVGWLLNSVTVWFNLPVHNFDLNTSGSFSVHSYTYAQFADSLKSILRASMIMIIFVLIQNSFSHNWVKWLSAILIAVSISALRELSATNLTSGELIWVIIRGVVLTSTIYFVINQWIRNRLWILILVLYMLTISKSGLAMLSWTKTYFHVQAIMVLILTSIPIVWLSFRYLSARNNEPDSR